MNEVKTTNQNNEHRSKWLTQHRNYSEVEKNGWEEDGTKGQTQTK